MTALFQEETPIIKPRSDHKQKMAGELGLAVSEYARNVVALGEMEHKTAELFEAKASFRLSRNEL